MNKFYSIVYRIHLGILRIFTILLRLDKNSSYKLLFLRQLCDLFENDINNFTRVVEIESVDNFADFFLFFHDPRENFRRLGITRAVKYRSI